VALVEPDLLRRTAELAIAHLEALPSRPVGATRRAAEIHAALAAPLPEEGIAPERVVEELVRDTDGGLVASPGGRYFGFVTGGVLPAALAADWLASAWDQNAFSAVSSPALAAIEAVAADWIKDVLGLPSGAGVGFTTGAQMANVTGLAVARQVMLARAGWDVAQRGLIGAPPLTVVVGEEAHVTVLRALRLLGLGSGAASVVPSDDQGRMRADALGPALDAAGGPAIVCTQAGNVNSGASDPFQEIIAIARARGAWVHVDGAFGLWAAASPELRHEVAGVEAADSWATDAHKWLNVPYDSGLVMVADAEAHRAAMSMTAAYLAGADDDERSNSDWVPEASRRGRGLAVYAALRSLGRAGVRELVERCCTLARRMAATLAAEPGLEILNDVVLNQVLVRVGGDDEATDATVAAVQRDGTCWLGGTRWQGEAALRISISSWATTEDDVDRSAAAIASAARTVLRSASGAGRQTR
jgi:glutamate/tyrosine decarboxylase-like PLP-dependent enzyme